MPACRTLKAESLLVTALPRNPLATRDQEGN